MFVRDGGGGGNWVRFAEIGGGGTVVEGHIGFVVRIWGVRAG